jgi:hypothetical protein
MTSSSDNDGPVTPIVAPRTAAEGRRTTTMQEVAL